MRLRRSAVRTALRASTFVVLVAAHVPAAFALGYGCSVEDLPTSVSEEVRIMQIMRHRFASGQHSSGALTALNITSKAIRDVTLMLEYLDDEKEPLFTMVYQGVERAGLDSFKPMVHAEYVDEFSQVIPAGGSMRIAGESRFATGLCPAGAKVTLVHVSFTDATSFIWFSRLWETDPLLVNAPDTVRISDSLARVARSRRIVVSVDIDAAGRVSQIYPQGELPGEMLSLLEEFFRRWTFLPAIVNGIRTNRQVLSVVRFHGRDAMAEGQASRDPIPRVYLLVDIIQELNKNDGWSVAYGGLTGAFNTRSTLRKRHPGP